VKLSAAERARVQKALDDLQMPPREQLLFAAKYMAPGSKVWVRVRARDRVRVRVRDRGRVRVRIRIRVRVRVRATWR